MFSKTENLTISKNKVIKMLFIFKAIFSTSSHHFPACKSFVYVIA